jgi:hypothetical protein
LPLLFFRRFAKKVGIDTRDYPAKQRASLKFGAIYKTPENALRRCNKKLKNNTKQKSKFKKCIYSCFFGFLYFSFEEMIKIKNTF